MAAHFPGLVKPLQLKKLCVKSVLKAHAFTLSEIMLSCNCFFHM